MKNGIKKLNRGIVIMILLFTISVYSFGQLGSSLNQATNNNANVDISRKKLDLSGFRMEPLDLENSNSSVIIREEEERSTFDDIILQIQTILWNEMPKYSNFYYRDQPPMPSTPKITDEMINENGDQVVIGEYTYNNDYYNNGKVSTPSHSFIFNATIKKILGKYTIKKVIYKNEGQWYRLFPENEDTLSENKVPNQTSNKNISSGYMVTWIDACCRVTETDTECFKIIPKGTKVYVLQKFGEYYLVKHDERIGYILANSLSPLN